MVKSWKALRSVAVAAVAVFAVVGEANQAFAGWRWHHSSGGSSGSSGSSGGSSGSWGSSGGSSGSWGSSGGSSGSWGSSGSSGGSSGHRHHHWRRHHSSSGGSSGSWGSSGGSSGSWGSSGGSSGSSGGSSGSSGGSSGGGIYYSPAEVYEAPVQGAPAPAPMAPAGGAAGQQTSTRRTEGLLSVNVPEEAKIFVNGQATTSTGGTRQYVSRDLQNGMTYAYEVRAEIVRDGKTIEQTKTIDLRAGATSTLDFDFDAQPVETSLTVRVPAEAKVYLAGNATTASGETRVFKTTGLSNGKGWNNYTVRVEMERDGKLVTEEKVISLAAGETKELSFFEVEKVASNR